MSNTLTWGQSYIECLITRKHFKSTGLKACTIGPVATARGSVTRRSETDLMDGLLLKAFIQTLLQ